MTKFAVTDLSHTLGVSLCKAAKVDHMMVRRVVLDLDVGKPSMMYLELFADKALLDVGLTKNGVEITYEP